MANYFRLIADMVMGHRDDTSKPEKDDQVGRAESDRQEESGQKIEVRMSASCLGEDSETVSVHIPRSLHERIMKLCAKDNTHRSAVVRSCLMVALPVLEQYGGMAEAFDPGGRDVTGEKNENETQ